MASSTAARTSRYRGSPTEPGSLVRSSTATRRHDGGNADTSAAAGNGRYRRTVTIPTLSPRAHSVSTASIAAPAPEPMSTTTRSASGAPWYSTSE